MVKIHAEKSAVLQIRLDEESERTADLTRELHSLRVVHSKDSELLQSESLLHAAEQVVTCPILDHPYSIFRYRLVACVYRNRLIKGK